MTYILPSTFAKTSLLEVSIILPTYNESENITKLLDSIQHHLPLNLRFEMIVVDDNSPDNTGIIAEKYAANNSHSVKVIHREIKAGLSSAILSGMAAARGEIVVVMDSDFSHPPEIISKMIEILKDPNSDLVVASRYVKGGAVIGWPFKRRVISKGATGIARHGLGVNSIRDPMSGFFAFKRQIIKGIKFDAIGYKILLEILVKAKGLRIREMPYTFTNRKSGVSKMSMPIIIDYVRAVWRLYRYGKSVQEKEKRRSVRFISKAARFYTVGASGLLVNYSASIMFGSVLSDLWYLHATLIGILMSITSNFVLNKFWTFGDRDFKIVKTLKQYGSFVGFSTLGALIQLGLLYSLIEGYDLDFLLSLLLAVAVASTGNFILNKRWTFNERIWG